MRTSRLFAVVLLTGLTPHAALSQSAPQASPNVAPPVAPVQLNLGGGPNDRSGAPARTLFDQLQTGVNGVINGIGRPGGTATLDPGGHVTLSQVPATVALPTDVSLSALRTDPLAVYRSLGARVQDQVFAQDYGAKPDFNGTTGTDSGAQFAGALQSGKCIRFPAGAYYFASTQTVPAGKPLCILGDGKEQTLIVFGPGAGHGFVAAPTNYQQPSIVRGVTLATLGNETGSAIKVSYPDADVNLYPYTERAVIDDVAIRGLTSMATGWSRGVDLFNVQWFYISNYNITGRRTNNGATAADNQHMTDGIYAGYGQQVSGIGFITRGQIYEAGTAVNIQAQNNAQGINIDQFNFVEVGNGVVQVNAGSDGPGLTANNGHINAYNRAIRAVRAPESVFGNLLVYKNPLATAETVMFDLAQSPFSSIGNTVAKNQTGDAVQSGGFVGARFTDSPYSRAQMTIERPSVAVDILGVTTQVSGEVSVAGTLTNGSTALVRDTSSGTNTIRMQPFAASGTNATFTPTTTTPTPIASTGLINAITGQRYCTQANVESLNGGVAGDVLLSLLLFPGSGTAVLDFGGGTTQVRERRQVAAGQDIVQNLAGCFTVSQGGTMNITAALQHTGGSGSVSAKGAVVSIQSY